MSEQLPPIVDPADQATQELSQQPAQPEQTLTPKLRESYDFAASHVYGKLIEPPTSMERAFGVVQYIRDKGVYDELKDRQDRNQDLGKPGDYPRQTYGTVGMHTSEMVKQIHENGINAWLLDEATKSQKERLVDMVDAGKIPTYIPEGYSEKEWNGFFKAEQKKQIWGEIASRAAKELQAHYMIKAHTLSPNPPEVIPEAPFLSATPNANYYFGATPPADSRPYRLSPQEETDAAYDNRLNGRNSKTSDRRSSARRRVAEDIPYRLLTPFEEADAAYYKGVAEDRRRKRGAAAALHPGRIGNIPPNFRGTPKRPAEAVPEEAGTDSGDQLSLAARIVSQESWDNLDEEHRAILRALGGRPPEQVAEAESAEAISAGNGEILQGEQVEAPGRPDDEAETTEPETEGETLDRMLDGGDIQSESASKEALRRVGRAVVKGAKSTATFASEQPGKINDALERLAQNKRVRTIGRAALATLRVSSPQSEKREQARKESGATKAGPDLNTRVMRRSRRAAAGLAKTQRGFARRRTY